MDRDGPASPPPSAARPRRPRRRPARPVVVRPTEPRDFAGIRAVCAAVYPDTEPYNDETLAHQLRAFAEGQLVAVEPDVVSAPDDETAPDGGTGPGGGGRVLGMASSLIVSWDDYRLDTTWRDFTDHGRFTNHDPSGRTLYGAEVMVHPDTQGRGVGKALYAARRDLCRRLGLLRIRAGGRLRGYHRHADRMTAEAYVRAVIDGTIGDPTLSFQLRQGFRVIGVVGGYLRDDPESLGHAAIIEWINHQVARRRDYWRRSADFARHRRKPGDR